jgi:hypothetical protein
MFSEIDNIIFPDRCEVIEVIPSQRYVYPIFKNGKSSLYHQAHKSGWRIKFNEQLRNIESIDIVLRDPVERLISGINSFVQFTLRDHPTLDSDTIFWFAKKYLFLDRHYAPQFFWLINLARYLSPEAKLCFLSMEDLTTITDLRDKPNGVVEPTEKVISQLQDLSNFEMYCRVDQLILDQIGTSITFSELITHIKKQDPAAYEYVWARSQKLNVLS